MDVFDLSTPKAAVSIMDPPWKTITFRLQEDSSNIKASPSLRITITSHGTTESMITVIKKFFGIPDSHGIKFQDAQGNSLTASYEGLSNDATVYVRAVPGSQDGMLGTSLGRHLRYHLDNNISSCQRGPCPPVSEDTGTTAARSMSLADRAKSKPITAPGHSTIDPSMSMQLEEEYVLDPSTHRPRGRHEKRKPEDELDPSLQDGPRGRPPPGYVAVDSLPPGNWDFMADASVRFSFLIPPLKPGKKSSAG
jgi:hypothetical protein